MLLSCLICLNMFNIIASKLRIDGVVLNSQAQQQDVPCERHGSRRWCEERQAIQAWTQLEWPVPNDTPRIGISYVYHITACHVVASHLRLDRCCTVVAARECAYNTLPK